MPWLCTGGRDTNDSGRKVNVSILDLEGESLKIYDYFGFMIQVLRNMQARGKGVSRKAAKQNGTDRAGYWSGILYHSKPLTEVPDDMRIRKKGRRK